MGQLAGSGFFAQNGLNIFARHAGGEQRVLSVVQRLLEFLQGDADDL